MSEKSFFWMGTQSQTKINAYLLRSFLIKQGYGLFQMDKNRTSSKDVFLNDTNILRIHDDVTIKSWIRDFLENLPEDAFKNDNEFDCEGGANKWSVLDKWQTYKGMGSEVLKDLPIYAEENYHGTEKLKLFNDKKGVAHIRFRNGVVKVTKDEIKIVPIESLSGEGAVWESMIMDRDIKIEKTKGVFEQFCERAVSKRDHDKNDSDWTKNYYVDEDQYQSLRTGYGYMLHTYNSPDIQKCLIFIDSDSDPDRAEGRNGKSLVMETVKYYKSRCPVDGKRWRMGADAGRFQFAHVTPETKFVMIDDVQPAFPFDMIFSMITGDMEIEKKGKDIVVIPREKKPKFGITTNYALPQKGTSYKARQHIVEFGNFWNQVSQMRESPADPQHLGKMLFSEEFTDDDWNQFYGFGFRCIQEFFNKGLIEGKNMNFEIKSRQIAIEGVEGDGSITQWMDDWCSVERRQNKYHLEGIEESKLYDSFIAENKEVDPNIWTAKKFREMFYQFISMNDKYDYNPQLAQKGFSLSARRWLKGSAGKQTRWVKITDK